MFNTFKTPADFIKGFVFTDDYWKQFIEASAKDTIDIHAIPAKEKNDLTDLIKAYIARQLWRTEGFYEVINSDDNGVKKAIEILEKK
jgi:carboxyl-terminal processing protease